MSERDWSVFIGERLDAPWTSDRAGAALMPEHLRQVVLLCAPSSSCCTFCVGGPDRGGQAGKWFTMASQIKLRLLLAVAAARRQVRIGHA